MSHYLETEVLIIGCGIAGGTAALCLADAGISVTIATRAKDPHESSTFYAQGGIIYEGESDSPELLAQDLTRAGAGHGNPQAIDVLAHDGAELVRRILLDKINTPFERTADGKLIVIREGAHSTNRILHVADVTGKAIEINLINAMKDHPNITILTEHTAIDLLTPAHHAIDRLAIYDPVSCVGAYLLDQKNEQVVCCLAKKTILATGGLGQIYLRTTNPAGARGDGLAMAYRAGARVINSEFVQFHPTTFFHRQAPPFLISEAVRGEGARLVHADGKPFMQKYDAEWKDLASRDVVSRSMHKEMLKRGVRNVYLDLASYISTKRIKEHFPNIYKQCLQYHVDITSELVPVVPGAHYFCGGVWVDIWGRTTLNHLYAVGEVSCTGLHGANRLASSSLLEGLVWGNRSARSILSALDETKQPCKDDIPTWRDTSTFIADHALIHQDMSSIQHIMWNYVGLVRTKYRLRRAISELRHVEIEIEDFYRDTRLTDSLIGLRNAVRSAIIIANAAWKNKTSIGCHYRQ
ncbi:MAG: L-aspartate oxidase [Anaerolineaceae bacterium 4572_78]|nr:MAG: L-aspartate oxidase [Anaerolineaceae bacterium 4572_78]